MAALTGAVSWGIVPFGFDTSNLASMSWDYRANDLKSTNDQLRYQVQWFYGNIINEGVEAVNEGDVVNVIFNIETSVDGDYWNTIANIKKSRDIANKRYNNGYAPKGHRFTIDISQLVSDQLSYSLCPINKGTWQSNYYGGMNGGIEMQDNVIGGNLPIGTPISEYNVSENGTFRKVRVSATFEILDDNKQIITASNVLTATPITTLINSVNQFERDSVYYNNSFNISDSNSNKYQFLTRCPNWADGSIIQDFKKPVRIDEQAEWLQFYINENDYEDIRLPSGTAGSSVGATAIKIITYNASGVENTFYLRDFEDNILTNVANSYTYQENYQRQMFIQNISPDYIVNSGNVYEVDNARIQAPASNYPYWNAYTGATITDSTIYYSAYLIRRSMWEAGNPAVLEGRSTKVYKYTIDRESENIPYGFVRFHWLNSLGGTDSYTAKRDVVEGLTISRDVIERKSGDRTWYQADSGSSDVAVSDSSYISDTMRGGNLYKGGREVSSVNADRVQSVYTQPLNKSVANWLEEMILSPNVWIEKDTEATAKGNSSNPYLRPSTKGYIPVIITNSDIETVNQENGLVRFNIEYTLAHKVQTQRN
tara:strand:+ start:398 stop:2185 length:1788 start_codon:yes stop_codon:yes gene_type:complete